MRIPVEIRDYVKSHYDYKCSIHLLGEEDSFLFYKIAISEAGMTQTGFPTVIKYKNRIEQIIFGEESLDIIEKFRKINRQKTNT